MRRGARVFLVVAVGVTVAGLSKLHAASVADPPYDYTGSSRFGWSLVLAVVLVVAAYGFGLPDLPRTPRNAALASGAASLLAAVVISLVQLLTGDALLPRFVVLGSALALVPIGVVANLLARGGVARAEQRDRVVLVGGPEDRALLSDELLRALRPASLVGFLTPGEAAGSSSALTDAVGASGATVVTLARTAQGSEPIVHQAAVLHEQGIRIRTLSQFYEEWLGKFPVSELERVSLFFDIGELHRARYGRVKRIGDVVMGGVGLVPLLLSVPFVLVGNLFGNRGPLLYRQVRVGRFGEEFQIVKYRTMRPTAPGELANEWTTENDPRITRFGRVLRATHLDELPQVLNILRGDLSVVGPRPEQPRYVAELTEKLPFYRLRHLVRPGLTGWAQVLYGYAGDESDALEKLQYEFFYLRHQGVGFDLRIVGRTIRSVLGSEGRGR